MMNKRNFQELNEPLAKKLRSAKRLDRPAEEIEIQSETQIATFSIEILNDDVLIKIFEFLPLYVWIRSERVCRRYVF